MNELVKSGVSFRASTKKSIPKAHDAKNEKDPTHAQKSHPQVRQKERQRFS